MTRHVLVWLLLAALVASPSVLADDHKDEKDDDRNEARDDEGDDDRSERRRLLLDVDDLKATIKLDREIAGAEDSVKIEFDASKAVVKVKHEEERDGNESEQKLEARFLALVEYVDADGDQAYDAGEAIASAWSLGREHRDAKVATNGTVAWSDIVVSDVSSGNATGKKLSSRASFGPNATFGLDFFVYGDFTMVGNASLAPTEAKIDIIIQHYPYVQNSTALAVLVDLKAKEEFKDGEDDDEGESGVFSEASAGNLTFRLTFTWLETATVDGVERAVHATVLRQKAEVEDDEISQKSRVAISYPRGDLIVHDPTMGVTYASQSADARAVPFPAVPLLLAGAAFIALARRRS